MAKHFKKALSAFLALLMCVSTFAPAVMAEAGTTWLGDDVDLTFQAGEDPYVYAIAQDSVNNRYYYETSNHTVQITGGGAVHIFPIVDTTKVTGEWTPDGIYENGVSNYDVMYCCDATTGTDGEIYYKRVNLEDSEYVSNTDAKRLRAIVENAYPYVSVEEAKAALKEAHFPQADELDRSELITATQAAIWIIANPDSGDTYRYTRTATTAHKLTWGGYMHEFAAEITNFPDSTTARKYLTNPNGTGDRVNALIDFYLAMEGVDAEAGQIVISNLEIKNSKIAGSDDTYKVTLGVELNHGADENDDVALNVYLNGEPVEESVDINEETEYTVNLVAKAKDKIKVEVTGMQNLERGVYFYAPKPQDIDGDGIATSREVSQNLIGVGSGETPVHAERNFTVDIVNVDLEINKVDCESKKPLTGAKFAIYDEEGQLVDTKTVGENGTLVFEGLIPGEYTLKETVAPFGYILPEEAIEVVIGEDGSVFFNGKELEGDITTTDSVVIEGEAVKSPEVTVDLVPGGDTDTSVSVKDHANAAKTVYAIRKVTAQMTEVEVDVSTLSNGVASILPALKFDRNDAADQKQQKIDRELYTDNGHFHDPDTFTVTDAPAGYPFKYVGHGDYSGHYVSHIRVVYKRDAAGNALKDANGNYVIDHLEHVSSGTPLYYNGELSTNVQGPFHYATGTRPQQFLLKNENGDLIYGYCIDLETGANSGTWYAIANLEDNNYYASEEAENHIRNIIENGYWGTESGTGSLASLKAALKAAVANGVVDKEYDVNLVNRKKFTTGYELQEGEYHYGSYVYWNVIPVDNEDHVVLTDDVIDGLTEGEALDAMQMAIWTFANGAMATLDGKDDVIVGDPYAASSQISDSLNAKNDYAGAARTKALYNYLISLDDPKESSVVINDKTFAKDMSLTVGNKIGDGIYKASLHFSLPVELGEQDNLTVKLTYVDAYGETQTIEKPLTGEGKIEARSGIYTIDGLALRAGEAFDFSLNIYGGQYLEKSAYILTSQGGTGASQTMVTLAEGWNTVDVTKSASITFEVEDYAKVTYNRYSYSVKIENVPEELDGDKESEHIDGNRFEISIEVPGAGMEREHDDVILMVDGSYSGDKEWPAMKEAINAIGRTVLDGNGNTQLTLMAFGMGDNYVLEHIVDADDLATALGELPGNLLRGVSSTNCEAGFTGVKEFVEAHHTDLKDAIVIFISDGGINTDETPRLFYYWQNYAPNVDTVINYALNGTELPAETTKEEKIELVNQRWKDVFELSGMDINGEYPISEMERAFLVYVENGGSMGVYHSFLMAMKGSKFDSYPNVWNRTYNSVFDLAKVEDVKDLYLVRYQNDGRATWMPEAAAVSESDNIHYVKSDSISTLTGALEGTLEDLALTPYNDVVITDYMSKWVNLDPSTLKIVDVSTGETIWTAVDGWLIAEELRPTAQEVPVIVELVDPADYAAGGEDVIGNTSGNIYKLTWYVKDGALLRSDNYKLVYEVDFDIEEPGFEYGKYYPANGNTDINYVGGNGGTLTTSIRVPNVTPEKPVTGTVTLKKVDENGKLISGAVFELYKIENGTEALIGTYELDNGKIAINNLAVGSYKLVETKAPKGYIGIDEPMYFEIVTNKSGNLEVKSAYELEFPATAYEISNHITSVAIPQTFVLLDAENAKNWTYSGEFVFGESNYDVVYCADSEIGVVDGTKYYRVDLADIFGEEAAAKLRAIVANSYPYVSVADMIAAAAAANVADAENLTRGDIIAAVQLAIWHYTNGIENYEYKATYSVEAYPRWGKVFHDYSNEIGESLPNDNNTAKIVDEASDARIRALYYYLLALESDAECDTDVFVYVPQGGKDVSQMLIGGTRTNFYTNGMEISVVNVAEKVTVPPTITFKKGDASNISFMLIDKKTGAVEFLYKVDIENQTSFEIPSEDGKISAVFVKQSTSGMFWFAENVDEATQQAVINCLKANNPSYKGHNAIAFGAGDHELEFKKNKFVTYTFTGKEVETEVDTPVVDEPVVDEPVVDEPVVDEPVVNTPVVEEPAVKTLNYEVKGAKITSWTVVDGITAIYIKGSGKVPSVLWTSEKAEGMTLINILVELDLLNNLPEYQFDTVGAHTFHYEQNKKKTVSVTYTFIEK